MPRFGKSIITNMDAFHGCFADGSYGVCFASFHSLFLKEKRKLAITMHQTVTLVSLKWDFYGQR